MLKTFSPILSNPDQRATGYDFVLSCSTAAQDQQFAEKLYDVLHKHLRLNTYFDVNASSPRLPFLLPFSSPCDINLYALVRECRVAVVILSDEYICSMSCMEVLRVFRSVAMMFPSVKVLPLLYRTSSSDLRNPLNLQRWRQAWRRSIARAKARFPYRKDREMALMRTLSYYHCLIFNPFEGECEVAFIGRIASIVGELVSSAQIESELKAKPSLLMHSRKSVKVHHDAFLRETKFKQPYDLLMEPYSSQYVPPILDDADDDSSTKATDMFLCQGAEAADQGSECEVLHSLATLPNNLMQLKERIGPCILMDLDVQFKRNVPSSKSIVLYRLACPEKVEFYFANAEVMAFFVGMGLPHSKVILDEDLEISVHEMGESEWDEQRAVLLMHCLRGELSGHLVIDCTLPTEDKLSDESGVNIMNSAEMSKLYGVGFHGTTQVTSTNDRPAQHQGKGMMLPSLYDVAHFVLRAVGSHKQCTNATGHTHSGSTQGKGGSSSSPAGNYGDGSGGDNLMKIKGQSGNEENAGDGEKGRDRQMGTSTTSVQDDADDLSEILRVTVYPLPKSYFLKPGGYDQVKSWEGLEGACIGVEMVFVFRKSQQSKDISISARSTLQLDTRREVRHDASKFGWYHHDIDISLGCVSSWSHNNHEMPQGRVAFLKQDSYTISNDLLTSSYKMSTSESTTASTTATLALDGKLGICGSASSEATTNRNDSIEASSDSICRGFFPKDSSSTESPARAKFTLVYPLDRLDIMWNRKSFLETQGLCSTINTCMKGTWIPFDDSEASPYEFTVARDMKLHQIKSGRLEDFVCKQDYVLLFYVNHAMSHLRRKEGQSIELRSDRQEIEVSNVLEVINLRDGPNKRLRFPTS